ncbi:carcinoembryonic antigen-related cell adhesion molecule 1-like [Sardina pilchardus]|uniref:carcinoembryonic antigen-related cell adhesion molecule 1-like n=1 Tax=Sardina pilchardus TaxID=27697 RepID=UPI002E1341AD
MADHMKLLTTIFIFTITECAFSLPISDPDPRGPFFPSISGPSEVMAGVPTDFTCSAECTPECVYNWKVTGKEVEGNVMTLTVSGRTESLELECTAVNPASNKSWSASKTVKINNPVSVQPTTSSDPQEGQSFTMTCQGSGPTIATAWFKDGKPLDTDARMRLSEHNATLAFRSLLPSDGGYYECEVANSTITVTSRGYLLSFGTIAVSILGPDTVEAGVEHNFTCQANCTLPCSITWRLPDGYIIGSFIANGVEVRWTPDTPGIIQSFQCIAQNSLAQRMAQATKRVTVSERPTTPTTPAPPPPPSGSVTVRPAFALISMVSLQLLFPLSV